MIHVGWDTITYDTDGEDDERTMFGVVQLSEDETIERGECVKLMMKCWECDGERALRDGTACHVCIHAEGKPIGMAVADLAEVLDVVPLVDADGCTSALHACQQHGDEWWLHRPFLRDVTHMQLHEDAKPGDTLLILAPTEQA